MLWRHVRCRAAPKVFGEKRWQASLKWILATTLHDQWASHGISATHSWTPFFCEEDNIFKMADFFLTLESCLQNVIFSQKMQKLTSLFIHPNVRSAFLFRTLYPKDLIIGAVTMICMFVLFGIAQSREPRIAKLKGKYPYLIPIAVVALAVLIIYALGSILVFIWGVTVPLAGIYIYQYR